MLFWAFERNLHVDGSHGTDCLTTRRVLYITTTTPVYFLVNFVGRTGNFELHRIHLHS